MWTDIRITHLLMALSRLLNGLTGGSFDEMLCSRIWRSSPRGRLVQAIDALMFRVHGEHEHCRNCTIYEYLRKANDIPEEDELCL
jgi:hypothetical protein